MDFFEHQDRARRNTGRLVILFGLAVLSIIVMTYIAVAAAVMTMTASQMPEPGAAPQRFDFLDPTLMVTVAGGVLLFVASGTLYKLVSLREGGRVIAEMLGGKLLDPQSSEADDRKLLNVVEEMALASGTPVPPVYVMEGEAGINAFAAGFSPDDAVIGVTRGCIRQLDRDELQGVIAHEFSHILNGDMKLNLRLIGLLHGILIIALAGWMLLRSMAYSGRRRTSSRNDKGGGGQLVFLALGLALVVIGYLGVFFGRVIKSAVSRQREYLADAAAVEFTRNPGGIAGALRKIGGLSRGAHLLNNRAEEASHMFFGQALDHWLGGIMATHPPLPERIRRIDPTFDGTFEPVSEEDHAGATRVRHQVAPAAGVAGFSGAARPTRQPPGARPAPAVAQVGQTSDAHLHYVATLIAALPDPVRDAARQPLGAQCLIYALLLDRRDAIAEKQIGRIATTTESAVRQEFARLAPHVQQVDARARLPLIDMALGALRELSPAQAQRFHVTLESLIEADDRVELFEWTLRRMVMRHLGMQRGKHRSHGTRTNLRSVSGACALLLSTLAYAGQRQADAARRVFEHAASRLGIGSLPMASPAQCNLSAVDHALNVLAELAPLQKRRVLEACAACVSADGDVAITEAELLRAIADSLDCPMPPLLPGQPVV